MLKQVTITADASSRGNGQTAQTRAAAAAVLAFQGRLRAVASYLGSLTNQQAEITACALGLEALREPCEVTVQTDSRYVVETMRGAFRRNTNLDFWARLDSAAAPHQVTWVWVKGHAGHREQEAADRLAQAVALMGEATPLVLEETISRLRNEITPALVNAVRDGVRYLAGACDGARQLDGEGFSRYDAEFGHRLASKPDLSPREVALGRGLLRKYRRQLGGLDPALVAII